MIYVVYRNLVFTLEVEVKKSGQCRGQSENSLKANGIGLIALPIVELGKLLKIVYRNDAQLY